MLVAVLGGATVAGAFLLPRGDDADSPLAAAARRTLAGPGYRMTIHGPNGSTGHEDYQAPDRVRTYSVLDGEEFTTTAIGDTLYGGASCTTPDGTVTGYHKQHIENASYVGTGTQLLLQAAGTPRATQMRPGVYEFSFRLTVPKRFEDRVHLPPVRVEAEVHHGKVSELVVHWRLEHRSARTRLTFAYGRLPEITAPTGPPLDMTHCTLGFTTS